MSASDEELLSRGLGGDTAALDELLARCAPQVRRRLWGKIPRRCQSLLTYDDVMQSTFLEVIVDFGRFREQSVGAFVKWLTTVAKNNLHDDLRALETEKRGGKQHRVVPRNEEESLAALWECLSAGISTPSGGRVSEEALAALRRAIAQLPAKQREVVEARDLRKEPIVDIADRLELTPGAVSMLRKRAHLRLREIMGSTSRYFSDCA